MSGIEAIAPVGAAPDPLMSAAVAETAEQAQVGFGEMIANGLGQVEAKIDAANDIVRDFALDDSIPIHQVTIALQEARLAVELAMQVRTRFVEAYREMMNMQL